jgi:hypothetical protein
VVWHHLASLISLPDRSLRHAGCLSFASIVIDFGLHAARTTMQACIPVFNDTQYFPSSWWTWQQPYPFYREPTTRPVTSDVGYYSAATTDTRFVRSLPQLQDLSSQPPPKVEASRRLPKLLPSSAKFSVATSTPIVVSCLGNKWLAELLKRLNHIKQRNGRVPEHRTILADLLGGSEAIWTLASIMLPAAPDDGFLDDPESPVEAPIAEEIIHIRGKVIYVDLVYCQEVCFKLTDETIEALLCYHDKVHCTNLRTNGFTYNDIDARLEKAKNDYHRAIHAFVFRTDMEWLREMQCDGSGELSFGLPEEAKRAIMALFKPLSDIVAPPMDINTLLPVLKSHNYSRSWMPAGGKTANFDGSWPRPMGEWYGSR